VSQQVGPLRSEGVDVEQKDGGFRKSSYSGIGNCVEVAIGKGDVRMRDSKNPGRDVLGFARSTWSEFLARAKSGDFDRDAS